jgi:hypothetical protein
MRASLRMTAEKRPHPALVFASAAGSVTILYMQPTKAYAAQSKDSPLAPHSIDRRQPTATDVQMEILFCGICHSDLHTARSEWGEAELPVRPGP